MKAAATPFPAGRIRAVLFDLDGTLVDSAPDLASAANRMRARRGLPAMDDGLFRPHTGMGARGMLRIAFDAQPGQDGYDNMRREFLAEYSVGLLERTVPFAGIDRLLMALAGAGLPWGIVTNKAEYLARPLVAGLPVLAGAAALIGGDTTAHAKPHPAPLLEAARRMAIEPAACLYVGDDERDIVAGRAAGMLTVAACYGYLAPGAQIEAWAPDAHIDHPLDLLKFLDLP